MHGLKSPYFPNINIHVKEKKEFIRHAKTLVFYWSSQFFHQRDLIWNIIHLGLWFAKYEACATLKHKCIAHFSRNQTIKIRRNFFSIIVWSQLELKHVKTTPSLLKLEPWNSFSHKVSIRFWTNNGNQTNLPHAMQYWNNTKLN